MIDVMRIDNRWLAVQVHGGREFAAAIGIRSRGYQDFVPSYEKRCHTFGGESVKRLPLFAGYVFVRFDAQNGNPIIKVPYVIRFVGVGSCPTPIDDAEIEALQIATSSQRKCGPCAFIDVGQSIEIKHGALKGLTGKLVRWKNKDRLVLSVSLLRQSVLVELHSYDVSPSSSVATYAA